MYQYLSGAFNKWKSIAKSYNEMEAIRKDVVSVKYSDKGSFDLNKFNSRKFTSKIKLLDSPEGLWENYETYSFNKVGLPIIGDFQHVYNKHTWSGYYVYEAEETRYIMFDHTDFIATTLEWVEWFDGKKQSWNSIRFQYSAAKYLQLDDVGFVEHVTKIDTGSLIWLCEIYNENEKTQKIETAECFYHSPGLGFSKSKKIYTYSADGKLEIIRSEMLQADNSIRTMINFARAPKGETLKSVIDRLSEQIANTILEALLKEKNNYPILQVEMCYRAVQDYLPSVRYATEQEVESFEGSAIYDFNERFFGLQWMKHELDWKMEEETEKLYVRFFSLIEESENWIAGENMLCLIAKKVTAKATAIENTHFSNNLFSYALDYELHFSELAKTFIKCGVSKSQVENWKRNGIL